MGSDSGEPNSSQALEAQPVFKKKNRSANIRKRAAQSEGSAQETEQEPEVNVRRNKTRKVGLAFSTGGEKEDAMFKYEASGLLQQQSDQGATKQIETETEHDRDARALREQVLAQAASEPDPLESEYKGANNYIDYRKGFRREHTIAAEKGAGWHGPLRGSTHIRSSVRFDYQPDICKDYKETGYCGYGDACKFMHDRGDYKSGWELERDWEQKQKEERAARLARHGQGGEDDSAGDDEDDEDDDGLPFACFLCRRPWDEQSDPVVTRCQHYFCEECALRHHTKNPRCFVCDAPTNGIFNVAKDILKKMKQEGKKE